MIDRIVLHNCLVSIRGAEPVTPTLHKVCSPSDEGHVVNNLYARPRVPTIEVYIPLLLQP